MNNGLGAKMFTVQIHSKGIKGSGIIIKVEENSTAVYVVTAKHCILGEKFDNGATIADIKIKDIYFGDVATEFSCTAEDTLLTSGDNEDLAIIKVDKKRLPHLFDQVPLMKLGTMGRDAGMLNFKGYPNYTDGISQTIWGLRPADDDVGRLFNIKVDDKFAELFGPNSEQANVRGFSGSGVYQISDGQPYCFGIIHDFQPVGNRFIATNALAIKSLLDIEVKCYEPWIEQVLSDNKLAIMLSDSCEQLGARFDDKGNYPVSLEKEFDVIARSDAPLKDIDSKVQAVQTILSNIHLGMLSDKQQFLAEFGRRRITPNDTRDILRQTALSTLFRIADEQFTKFINIFESIELKSSDTIDLTPFLSRVEEMSTRYLIIAEFIQRKIKKPAIGELGQFNRVRLIQSELQQSANVLNDLRDHLLDIEKYLSCKFVLVNGKGGNGKSQLLAHMANRWKNFGHAVVLSLGQRFLKSIDPFGQFLTQLGIHCDWETFLSAMQAKSHSSGKISFIIIDALNEGKGLALWNKSLLAFLKTLDEYPGIKVIMSYRDSFKAGLFRDIELPPHLSLRHNGFLAKERDAMKVFFDSNGIDYSKVPYNSEFSNPLYLKLFCIAFGNGALVEGLNSTNSIFMIIERVILHVNEVLGGENNYNYKSEKINLVDKAVDAFVKKLVEINEVELDYESSFLLIDAAVGMFIDKKGFVNGLVDEEILYDNLSSDGKTYTLDFAYQRFGEHLKSRQILGSMGLSEIKDGFLPNGKLFNIFLDSNKTAQRDTGLIEAMTIQVQDRFGVELLEFAPALTNEPQAVNAFVLGTIQNTGTESASEAMIEFVKNSIIADTDLREMVWVDLLMKSDEGKSFNAEFLHSYLMGFSMAERDATWTIFINGEFRESLDGGLVSSLLVRALNAAYHPEPTDEMIWLNGLTLAWLLCSSNRALRDQATKALIILFKKRAHLLVRLVNEFQSVNDPYILQRIYAIVYGVVVKSPATDSIKEVGQAVFRLIFSSQEVYPDALLRDYARATIDHCMRIGITFNFDYEKIIPPYKSKSFNAFPTNEEVDKYSMRSGANVEQNGSFGAKMLLASMVTEYGRGTARYGDFGRYTFGSALRNWKGHKDNSLSNLAVKIIFDEFGYSEELHGWYDSRHAGGRTRRDSHVERLGKKYQWIAFYQILARVADNEEFTDRFSNTKKLVKLYHGPWNPFFRDIDPTLVRSFKERTPAPEWLLNGVYEDWNNDDPSWFRALDKLPDPTALIAKRDVNNDEWLILNGNTEWTQTKVDPKAISKRLSYSIRSFICSVHNYSIVLKWFLAQDTWDENIHQVPSNYAVFNREYFNSTAYMDSELEQEEIIELVGLNDHEQLSGNVAVTSTIYNWEAETDYSLERNITFYKVSNNLFKLMELREGNVDGDFEDSDGKILATDPSLLYEVEPSLIIRKKELFEMLEKSDKIIIWAVYGQKTQMNGFSDNHMQTSRSIVYFEKGKAKVSTKFSKEYD